MADVTITTYAELKTAAALYLNRTDLTDQIPLFIRLAELRIYRDLRIRAMEATLSAAIAAGVVAVPTGYVEMKNARIDGSPSTPLERKDAEFIYHRYPTRSADGTPRYFAREAENFIFGPYPDSNYTVKGTYYKKLAALSGTNTTNWFITDAPDLLLFGTLLQAMPYLENDPRMETWGNMYAAAKDRVQREDDNEEFSGSPLSASPR